jgi:hypothetical protein
MYDFRSTSLAHSDVRFQVDMILVRNPVAFICTKSVTLHIQIDIMELDPRPAHDHHLVISHLG